MSLQASGGDRYHHRWLGQDAYRIMREESAPNSAKGFTEKFTSELNPKRVTGSSLNRQCRGAIRGEGHIRCKGLKAERESLLSW